MRIQIRRTIIKSVSENSGAVLAGTSNILLGDNPNPNPNRSCSGSHVFGATTYIILRYAGRTELLVARKSTFMHRRNR